MIRTRESRAALGTPLHRLAPSRALFALGSACLDHCPPQRLAPP
ncbi:hypothetical protein [Xanthomonas tesorieronis]